MIKLGIGLPVYGYKLDAGHAAMWLGLGAMLSHSVDKIQLRMFTEYDINGIDLCRNTIVHDAMTADCDWVFMIDADTFHHSAAVDGNADAIADAGVDIIQMIRDADRGMQVINGELQDILMPDGRALSAHLSAWHRTGVGLIGAPVRGRGGAQGVCVHGVKSAERGDEPGLTYWSVGPEKLEDLRGRVQPVGRIGGACIAVNCGWLRSHWRQGPWFEMKHDYSGRPKNARGEDYSICDGIWERGGVVLCDGRFVPEHVDRRRLVGADEYDDEMAVEKTIPELP